MRPSPITLTACVTLGLVIATTARVPARADTQNLSQIRIAQNYSWCLISSAYEGGQNCGFSSFEQCQASRLGIGGFCQSNPQYQPGAASFPPYAPGIHRRS